MENLTFDEKLDAIKRLLISTIGRDAGDQLLLSIENKEPSGTSQSDVPNVQDIQNDSAGAEFEDVIIFNGGEDIQPGLNIGDIVTIDSNPLTIEEEYRFERKVINLVIDFH